MLKTLCIAIPAYNMENYLDQCLASLADAGLDGRVEVIVVDDGSKDRTARIAREYAERYPGLFCAVSQQNAGHGGAVNRGLSEAGARYFRVLDADDWMEGPGLKALVDFLERTDADAVVDERVLFDMKAGRETHQPLPEGVTGGEAVASSGLSPALLPYIHMHSLSIRTDLLKPFRLPEHTYYVDFLYAFIALTAVRTVAFVRRPVYIYRLGNDAQSVSRQNYVKNYDQHDRVLDACLEVYKRVDRESARDRQLMQMLTLLVHTQLNIALLFDGDRRRGRRRAKALLAKLERECPALMRRVARRYAMAMMMNRLHLDYDRLTGLREKLKRAR